MNSSGLHRWVAYMSLATLVGLGLLWPSRGGNWVSLVGMVAGSVSLLLALARLNDPGPRR